MSPLNVTIIGSGPHAAARRRVVERWPGAVLVDQVERLPHPAEGDPASALTGDLLRRTDVAFVTVPTAAHYRVAEVTAKRGVHLFLEWPPATSIRECASIVQMAEEAGVEVGISRPLRFHPLFEALPEKARIRLIVLRQEVDAGTPAFWPPRCADALDLCCALAQSQGVQRIDAEAVPRHAAWPDAVAFALRFHSGTYAQVSLYRRQRPGDDLLYVTGAGFQFEADLDGTALHGQPRPDDRPAGRPPPIERETEAFLNAIATGALPPVSVLDGLHTMRLVERLMEQLR